MKTPSHLSKTLAAVMMLLAVLTAPVQADVGGGAPSALGSYLNPSVTYPEAEFQRYVITNGNSTQDVRVVYPGDTCAARKLDSPVLTVNPVLAGEVLDLTNLARKERGLRPLEVERALEIAAEGHATEMLTLDYLSHTSPTPGLTTPQERAELAGSPAAQVSESLYQGALSESSARQVLDSWLSAPETRRSLLEPGASTVGLGVVEKHGKVSITLLVGQN